MQRNVVKYVIEIVVVIGLLSSCKATPPTTNVSNVEVEDTDYIPLSKLPQSPFNTPYFYTSTSRVSRMILKAHYKAITFDDEFSSNVFDRLIEIVDPDKELLSNADIAALEIYRTVFDEPMVTRDQSQAHAFFVDVENKKSALFSQLKQSLNEQDVKSLNGIMKTAALQSRFDTQTELMNYWKAKLVSHATQINTLPGTDTVVFMRDRLERIERSLSQQSTLEKYCLLMNAYAKAVDPNTSFLPPRDQNNHAFNVSVSEEAGVGVLLSSHGLDTVLRRVLPGSPAESAGLSEGDTLVGYFDNASRYNDLVGVSNAEIIKILTGPENTKLTLVVSRFEDESKALQSVELVRKNGIISNNRTTSFIRHLKNSGLNIGVIKVDAFYNNVSLDIKAELEALKTTGIDHLIVDISDNGGGSLAEATKVFGLFIPNGPVLQIRNGAGKTRIEKDTDGITFYEGPLTVLVNASSAGSSEILAAAIQDYDRGIVVGEQTYGYGSIQQVRPLSRIYDLYDQRMGTFQFTIAKFYRVTGDSTQIRGVVPDISIEHQSVDTKREGDKPNALNWEKINKASFIPFSQTQDQVAAIREKTKDIKIDKSDKELLDLAIEMIELHY